MLTFEADETRAKSFFLLPTVLYEFQVSHFTKPLCWTLDSTINITLCNFLSLTFAHAQKIGIHAYRFPGVFLIAYFYTHAHSHTENSAYLGHVSKRVWRLTGVGVFE